MQIHAQHQEASVSNLFGNALTQLAFDFERALPRILEKKEFDVTYPPEALTRHGSMQTESAPATFNNESYIRFAIEMLLTCAQDLVRTRAVQSSPNTSSNAKIAARKLEKTTCAWLNADICGQAEEHSSDAIVCAFGYHSCIKMLEEEMQNLSHGEIEIPPITERAQELARWIQSDPEMARDALGRYRNIFSGVHAVETTERFSQNLADSFTRANTRPRAN